MTPSLPPEVVFRLVHRDAYPELAAHARRQAARAVPEGRRLRLSPAGAVLAKPPIVRFVGAVTGRVARLSPARGH